MTITITTMAALSTCAIEGNEGAQRALTIIRQWQDAPWSVVESDWLWLETFLKELQ